MSKNDVDSDKDNDFDIDLGEDASVTHKQGLPHMPLASSCLETHHYNRRQK